MTHVNAKDGNIVYKIVLSKVIEEKLINKPINRHVSKQQGCNEDWLYKGIYLSKALTCMNIFLYKQELHFCQGDGHLWSHCCMNNLYISH